MADGPPLAPGAGVALVTLFDADGKLLLEQTAELAARLVQAHASALLVAGTTGEYYMLDDRERSNLFHAVRAAVPLDTPVIAHVGGVNIERAKELARSAEASGADAALALAVGPEDLAQYHEALAASATRMPILAYHLPQAGAEVALEALVGLGVVGIKDSSGDPARLAEEATLPQFEVYTGAAARLTMAHELRIAGALLAMSNSHPELCQEAFAGDVEAQQRLDELAPEASLSFPSGYKKLTATRWGVPAFARTPAGLTIGRLPAGR